MATAEAYSDISSGSKSDDKIARSARGVPADLKARAQLTAEALRNKIQSRYLLYWQAMARTYQWQICTINSRPNAAIDVVGWLFSGLAVGILIVAAVIAYAANV